MYSRQQKAQELADRGRVVRDHDGGWNVFSLSSTNRYRVGIGPEPFCNCEDFELRQEPCKHILATRIVAERGDVEPSYKPAPAPEEPPIKWPQPTYKQDWPNYNAAQVNERGHFLDLLADLCAQIPEPPRTCRGRKPIPLFDQAFAAVLKVYSLFSARRFMGDLEDARERGYIGKTMHFNSVLNALENPALTPILHDMIRRSSLPLAVVERVFSPDSTGFCTSRFIRWYDVKYGSMRQEAEWVKAHLMTGVKTNIVTAVEILDKDAGDSPQFKPLLAKTAEHFTVEQVPADKAYCSGENHDAVDTLGATMYAPFKSNATGGVGGVFEKMYHYFCLNKEDFLKHYHQRSNIESTISAIKRKFGDSVKSKSDTAMVNEVLAKVVCHNVCCCIAEWYILGIEPVFALQAAEQPEEGPCILPMRRPG